MSTAHGITLKAGLRSARAGEEGPPRAGRVGRLLGRALALVDRRMNRRALDLLEPMENDRILEVGFGPGELVRMLEAGQPVARVAGVDVSRAALRRARRRNAAGIRRGRVDLRLAPVSRLPFPDQSFDKAAAVHGFRHWDDPLAGLAELRRVLKPLGILVLGLQAGRFWRPLRRAHHEAALGGAMILLRQAGFDCRRVGQSLVLAQRPEF